MHIAQISPKRRRLSLTPLIDVIFLLLLFFMLSSTFSKFSELEINSGSSGSGTVSSEVIFLVLYHDSQTLEGEEIAKKELLPKLTQAKENGKGSLVLIVAENVTSQDFLSLLQMVNSGPLPVSVARRS